MQSRKPQLSEFFQRWLKGNLTDKDFPQFAGMLQEALDTGELEPLLQNTFEDMRPEAFFSAEQVRTMAKTIVSGKIVQPVKVKRLNWRYWVAAASVFLVIALGVYFIYENTRDVNRQEQNPSNVVASNDIHAAHQQVMITLGDGTSQSLDSIANGHMQIQGSDVTKNESSISYRAKPGTAVEFNTITTQKGRLFHLLLADGTQVWLDAMSSIRFPTDFVGKERQVEVTGQAYFEVAKKAHQPFRVKSGNQTVEVLGTHFNINAYRKNEIQTTLLEGSVKVVLNNRNARSMIIKPGQQVSANQQKLVLNKSVNLDEITAWRNGDFLFSNATIESIIEQVRRWYDVEVLLMGATDEKFSGSISRTESLAQLLKILEATGKVDILINGQQIIIKPK